MNIELDLSKVNMQEQAIHAWEKRDVMGVLCSMDNHNCLEFVANNIEIMLHKGLYEKFLFDALIGTRTNNRNFSLNTLRYLLFCADINKMQKCGDQFPGNGPYTIYRGVAGIGAARRIRGISWTVDFERAKWFAKRFPYLKNPAVYKATIEKKYVFAYCNDRQEQEFIIDSAGLCPKKPKRILV